MIIGSAHNYSEIQYKIKQGCKHILLSRLFKVNYDSDDTFLGIIKFNNLVRVSKKIVPLGGINSSNLNKLKNIISEEVALMTEIKKKPAISSRLF